MTSAAQRRGDGFELDVWHYLREHGIDVHRLHRQGVNDEGDLLVGPFVAEAKSYVDVVRALREAVDEALVGAARMGGGAVPLGIVKRPRRSTSEAYAVMRLADLVTLIRRMG